MSIAYTLRRLFFVAIVFGTFLLLSPLSATASDLKAESQYGVGALAPGSTVDVDVRIVITAPPMPVTAKRQPVAVSLVVDRSGSMDEAKKIDYARKAAKILVNSLSAEDEFALVVYDVAVQTLYPLEKIRDKAALQKIIAGIETGSTTNLSGGLEEGIRQIKKAEFSGPRRVILVSDGLANVGVRSVEGVAAITARASRAGINVSSIGLGDDFNEDMLQLMAQRGGGQY